METTSSPYGKEAANMEVSNVIVTDFPELRNTKKAYSISSTALARAQGGIPSSQGMSFIGVTSHTNRISPQNHDQKALAHDATHNVEVANGR